MRKKPQDREAERRGSHGTSTGDTKTNSGAIAPPLASTKTGPHPEGVSNSIFQGASAGHKSIPAHALGEYMPFLHGGINTDAGQDRWLHAR